MNEADVIRIVRETIRQELAPIMMARVVSNQNQNRSTLKRFPSDAPIQNMRNIQPFGISSRAPVNTPALIIPVAGDITHQNMVGHFDESRPAIDDGETILYGADGQVVFMKSGGTIHQGSKSAASPAVLGDVLKTLEDNVLSAWIDNASAVAFDGFGLPCVLSPVVQEVLTTEKSDHVDAAGTNFLCQKNFVDRGA